jgi:tRNA pseudouridine13 synthase
MTQPESLAFAFGPPAATGKIRQQPQDFVVEEILGFEPSGEGEHVFLQIQKTGENTECVARQLAKFAGVSPRDVGFAGLKDRHAVTTQWFSVWLPRRDDVDWNAFNAERVVVLQSRRHARKLKRGVLASNRFQLVVQDWQDDDAITPHLLTRIQQHGIPNYFGEQRFGMRGDNVANALALFAGKKVRREQRSIYLSAARSFLFNALLSRRVADNTWNQAITGDVFQIDGSHSCFKSAAPDADIIRRLADGTIHPTGVLWGEGAADAGGEALALEQEVIARHPDLAAGLVAAGLNRDRRALRVNVADLAWQFKDETLELGFQLPAGSYATAVLREIVITV